MASSTPNANASTSSDAFPFPREWYFPAFFSRQSNAATRHAQQSKWAALVVSYARFHRLFRLTLGEDDAFAGLFANAALRRRLPPEDVRELVEFMRREGSALRVRADAGQVFVLWRSLEGWARLVEGHVVGLGLRRAVFTVYEIVNGEGTRGSELHGMDEELLLRALQVLVKQGKAQVFGNDSSLGVKFF